VVARLCPSVILYSRPERERERKRERKKESEQGCWHTTYYGVVLRRNEAAGNVIDGVARYGARQERERLGPTAGHGEADRAREAGKETRRRKSIFFKKISLITLRSLHTPLLFAIFISVPYRPLPPPSSSLHVSLRNVRSHRNFAREFHALLSTLLFIMRDRTSVHLRGRVPAYVSRVRRVTSVPLQCRRVPRIPSR